MRTLLTTATLLATATLLLTGCSLKYEVDMTPTKDGLSRTTTMPSDAQPAELNTMRQDWTQGDAAKETNRQAQIVFSGDTHTRDWDDGFGGLGLWTTYESPLGTTTCFLECLGGNTHVLDDLMALQDGIDAAAQLFIDLLKKSMKGDPLLPAAIRVLNKRAIADVQDAAVMGWALLFGSKMLPGKDIIGNTPGGNRLEDFVEASLEQAIVAFLWQRDWITDAEAVRMCPPWRPSKINHVDSFIARIMARALKMKMTGDWQTQLQTFITNAGDALPEDLDKQLTKAFVKEVGDRPQLQVAWAATIAVLTSRTVNVYLGADSKPTTTNGIWNAAKGRIAWTLDTAPLAVGLTAPPLCWSATWAHPDVDAQHKTLGHVNVTDEMLAEFVLAWNSATPEQQKHAQKVLDSYAHARSGTKIKASGDELVHECLSAMSK